jgi:hypothetical protein
VVAFGGDQWPLADGQSSWWWRRWGRPLACAFLSSCNVCRASILAHDKFFNGFGNSLLCVCIDVFLMRADKERTAKCLYHANFCRAAFVVRFREKHTAKPFSCALSSLPCINGAQQSLCFP